MMGWVTTRPALIRYGLIGVFVAAGGIFSVPGISPSSRTAKADSWSLLKDIDLYVAATLSSGQPPNPNGLIDPLYEVLIWVESALKRGETGGSWAPNALYEGALEYRVTLCDSIDVSFLSYPSKLCSVGDDYSVRIKYSSKGASSAIFGASRVTVQYTACLPISGNANASAAMAICEPLDSSGWDDDDTHFIGGSTSIGPAGVAPSSQRVIGTANSSSMISQRAEDVANTPAYTFDARHDSLAKLLRQVIVGLPSED